jgi:hypothetical protein
MQSSEAVIAPPRKDAAQDSMSGLSAADRQLRLQRVLKMIVIGLAVLLVSGIALVIGRIIYLASPAHTDDVQVAAPTLAIPPEQRLELPAGAQVRSVSLSGNRLAVHYDAGGRAGIAVLDLQAGRRITTVVAEPKGAGN